MSIKTQVFYLIVCLLTTHNSSAQSGKKDIKYYSLDDNQPICEFTIRYKPVILGGAFLEMQLDNFTITGYNYDRITYDGSDLSEYGITFPINLTHTGYVVINGSGCFNNRSFYDCTEFSTTIHITTSTNKEIKFVSHQYQELNKTGEFAKIWQEIGRLDYVTVKSVAIGSLGSDIVAAIQKKINKEKQNSYSGNSNSNSDYSKNNNSSNAKKNKTNEENEETEDDGNENPTYNSNVVNIQNQYDLMLHQQKLLEQKQREYNEVQAKERRLEANRKLQEHKKLVAESEERQRQREEELRIEQEIWLKKQNDKQQLEKNYEIYANALYSYEKLVSSSLTDAEPYRIPLTDQSNYYCFVVVPAIFRANAENWYENKFSKKGTVYISNPILVSVQYDGSLPTRKEILQNIEYDQNWNLLIDKFTEENPNTTIYEHYYSPGVRIFGLYISEQDVLVSISSLKKTLLNNLDGVQFDSFNINSDSLLFNTDISKEIFSPSFIKDLRIFENEFNKIISESEYSMQFEKLLLNIKKLKQNYGENTSSIAYYEMRLYNDFQIPSYQLKEKKIDRLKLDIDRFKAFNEKFLIYDSLESHKESYKYISAYEHFTTKKVRYEDELKLYASYLDLKNEEEIVYSDIISLREEQNYKELIKLCEQFKKKYWESNRIKEINELLEVTTDLETKYESAKNAKLYETSLMVTYLIAVDDYSKKYNLPRSQNYNYILTKLKKEHFIVSSTGKNYYYHYTIFSFKGEQYKMLDDNIGFNDYFYKKDGKIRALYPASIWKIIEPSKVCPAGWRVPNKKELEAYIKSNIKSTPNLNVRFAKHYGSTSEFGDWVHWVGIVYPSNESFKKSILIRVDRNSNILKDSFTLDNYTDDLKLGCRCISEHSE